MEHEGGRRETGRGGRGRQGGGGGGDRVGGGLTYLSGSSLLRSLKLLLETALPPSSLR